MKAEQISPHIWALRAWLLFPVRVWVVTGADGVTLVDAGFPFMARGILKFIEQLNAGPLQRILLTHGHSDHVGALQEILAAQAVPVYAHRVEFPYMEGDLPYPRRKKAAASVAKGLAQPLPEAPDGGLQTVAGLRPYLTPGHSPGHVVYYHEQDQVLLAGDLFTSRRGQLRRPMAMFTADMATAIRSSAVVEHLNPQRLEVSHGGPVLQPARQVPAYRAAAASLTGGA
jgi:glyoxylase-like metal-dependent hydrolase (beta-lactamase superfamily II)